MAKRSKHLQPLAAEKLQPSKPPHTSSTTTAVDAAHHSPPLIANTDQSIQHSIRIGGTTQVSAQSITHNTAQCADTHTQDVQHTLNALDTRQDTPAGDASVTVLESPPVAVDSPPRPREDLKITVKKRLEREGRWEEVAPVRDQMMKEARQTMNKESAQAWVYAELDRLYPTLDLPEADAPADLTSPDAVEVAGVYTIPSEWPALPGNATLQAELSWVQAERLRVVETRGNAVSVHLDRASCPAPSMSALGWLETSIRSYAKYVDILARALQGQVDDQEHERRERASIVDIQDMLSAMHMDA